MDRIARVVVPGMPHHVTQRGVRSLPIFDDDQDRKYYVRLLKEKGDEFALEFIAWCLMTNHVHFVVVPSAGDSIARAIGEAHKRYTFVYNRRHGVKGYLFQGRFGSYVLAEAHEYEAIRYVELNAVKAGMVKDPAEYGWSSARFHLGSRKTDPLVNELRPLHVQDWREYLDEGIAAWRAALLEKHLRTGRPCGDEQFVQRVGEVTGRELRLRKRGWPKGRKRKK